MKIKPVLTEKSMAEAKAGRYTFWVSPELTKYQIKELIGRAFSVRVSGVFTQRRKGRVKTTLMRRKINVKPAKKAIVTLSGKDKIDLFEGEKKKAKK